jgi:hypothetical protein
VWMGGSVGECVCLCACLCGFGVYRDPRSIHASGKTHTHTHKHKQCGRRIPQFIHHHITTTTKDPRPPPHTHLSQHGPVVRGGGEGLARGGEGPGEEEAGNGAAIGDVVGDAAVWLFVGWVGGWWVGGWCVCFKAAMESP